MRMIEPPSEAAFRAIDEDPQAKVIDVGPPEGAEEIVGPARALISPGAQPYGEVRLFFDLDDEERQCLAEGGLVELKILGPGMPPVSLRACDARWGR